MAITLNFYIIVNKTYLYNYSDKITVWSLQENVSLTTNFRDKKLLVTIVTNLNTNLQNKKLLVTKIVTIMNKKL